MKLLLSFLLLSPLLSCQPRHADNITHSTCNCEASPADDHLILDAINDSIVICDSVRMFFEGKTYTSWAEFLSLQPMIKGGNEELRNCRTGEVIAHEPGEYSLLYKNKQLSVSSHFPYQYWDTTAQRKGWQLRYGNLYEERIYAIAGEIKTSRKKLVIEPPYVNKEALISIHNMFDSIYKLAEERRPYSVNQLLARLFTAALNKDKPSRSWLMNFSEYFPKEIKDENLGQYQHLLDMYESQDKPE